MTPQKRAVEAHAAGREMTSARTTVQLCDALALSAETLKEGFDPAVPVVRGWIMAELERRDPAAYEAWLWSDDDAPHAFYGVGN